MSNLSLADAGLIMAMKRVARMNVPHELSHLISPLGKRQTVRRGRNEGNRPAFVSVSVRAGLIFRTGKGEVS
jgi:hypothetical protein